MDENVPESLMLQRLSEYIHGCLSAAKPTTGMANFWLDIGLRDRHREAAAEGIEIEMRIRALYPTTLTLLD